jgi:uncharacterized cupredoxin-like copper-binding protein
MSQRFLRGSVASIAMSLALAACGSSATSAPTAKADSAGVVKVSMRDARFEPNTVELRKGQTVTFQFVNDGKVTHEAFIGTDDEQQRHEHEMMATPSTSMGSMETSTGATSQHSPDESMVVVASGATGTLRYTAADVPQQLVIGCHQPGHWAAGMHAVVRVI